MADKIIYYENDSLLTAANGQLTFKFNKSNSLSSIIYNGLPVVSNFYSEFTTLENQKIRSTDFKKYYVYKQNIEDRLGRGIQVDIEYKSDGEPGLRQVFHIYEELPFVVTQVIVSGYQELATNYIAPVCGENKGSSPVIPGGNSDTAVLFVPYDNDKWIRYESKPAEKSKESYEVTAVYHRTSQKGLIAGSLTHDVWKTGIAVNADETGEICRFKVYNGAAGEITRDTIPHGYVHGSLISSSKIFIGFYPDYKAGLVEFAKANARLVPPLSWNGGVPFGWNSWAALENTINYEKYINTSDFIKNELQHRGFNNKDIVYVNYDAFWTSLSKEQLSGSVKHVNRNGQKAGIYYTPFAFWGKNFDTPVEGSEGRYKYSDILLKDRDGKILPDLDGGHAIDPTHPANTKRVELMLEYFVKLGFEYIKLDFMAHGALEGVHYLKDITTGTMAYNYGMSHITGLLDPERIGRNFFINLSIAPLFPYQYAHSRRISCDAFGSIKDSEYMLNSVTYGWWFNNILYKYSDPDHVVLYKSFKKPPISGEEARTRFNASVIAGTVLLFSEDIASEDSRKRCKQYLLNDEVNNLARKGVSFIPLYENEDSTAANVYLHKEEDNTCYLALFNFNTAESMNLSIRLETLFGKSSMRIECYDLWDKTRASIRNVLNVGLSPCQSKLFKLSVC